MWEQANAVVDFIILSGAVIEFYSKMLEEKQKSMRSNIFY